MTSEISEKILAEFVELWNVKYAHNLSMPELKNIDWEGIARECFLLGVRRGMNIADTIRDGGTP
jgi:hypothetical protein